MLSLNLCSEVTSMIRNWNNIYFLDAKIIPPLSVRTPFSFLCTSLLLSKRFYIHRRSDYIIGFIAPAIGPNKSRKLTRLIETTYMASQTITVCLWSHACIAFHSNFAAYIVCRRDKPCEFPGFVWTDCWGNKSYYAITSPVNRMERQIIT